jgi:hypothetical protein
VKEHPILMQGAMSRATLAGTKTQTRRIFTQAVGPSLSVGIGDEPGVAELSWLYGDGPGHEVHESTKRVPCPYGQPGDRLWVKETFFAFGRWETRFSAKKGRDEWHFLDMTLETGHSYCYAADGSVPALLASRRSAGVTPAWWKRPAIFMPRVASRILLEITGVRVERLQNISEVDAVAEGLTFSAKARKSESCMGIYECRMPDGFLHFDASAVSLYRKLWEQINGAGSWDANPWVWVVEFRRVLP